MPVSGGTGASALKTAHTPTFFLCDLTSRPGPAGVKMPLGWNCPNHTAAKTACQYSTVVLTGIFWISPIPSVIFPNPGP